MEQPQVERWLPEYGRAWEGKVVGRRTAPGPRAVVGLRWRAVVGLGDPVALEPPELSGVLPASAEPLDARGSLLVVLDRTELGKEVIRMVLLGEETESEGGAE